MSDKDIERAVSKWIANQINACEDGDEQYRFMVILLRASISAFFFPNRNDTHAEKVKVIKGVAALVGDIVGKAASKFLHHKKGQGHDA